MVIVQSQSFKEIDVNHVDSSNVVQLECEQIQSGFQSSFKLNHFHKTSLDKILIPVRLSAYN